MLNVSDQEIQFFKQDVEQFSDIDSQIKELKKKMKPFQDKIKELNKQKKDKQDEVLAFMESNQIDICNTDNTSYELKNTKSTKQLTKGDVYDKIYSYISGKKMLEAGENDEDKAKHLHNYIYIDGREFTLNKTLKSK